MNTKLKSISLLVLFTFLLGLYSYINECTSHGMLRNYKCSRHTVTESYNKGE